MKEDIFKDLSSYTDQEIINLLKNDSNALELVYKKHKSYCINFMKRIYNNHTEIIDIFQDAIIVLYEKINTEGFKLTCSIQTYLNSICRNQILKRINSKNKHEITTSGGEAEFFDSITDWFDDKYDVNTYRVEIIKDALKEMKQRLSRCYEILVRFYYLNQDMNKIAIDLGYTNADNAKNQKYRCQEKLKYEVSKSLKNEHWKKRY